MNPDMEPHLGEGEVVWGSARFPIGYCDHCTICSHSAAICYRMSPTLKSTGRWVTLGPNLGVPLWVDPCCLGLQRANIPG